MKPFFRCADGQKSNFHLPPIANIAALMTMHLPPSLAHAAGSVERDALRSPLSISLQGWVREDERKLKL